MIASSTAVAVALTWGGIQFPWSSAQILVPLILGLIGIGAWFVYEGTWAIHPIVRSTLGPLTATLIVDYAQIPYRLLSNKTSLSG